MSLRLPHLLYHRRQLPLLLPLRFPLAGLCPWEVPTGAGLLREGDADLPPNAL
jgi:hypothetical protein